MIISDLKHFEEVVTEAPSIVGGRATQLGKVIDPKTADKLEELGLGNLLGTTVNVNSVSVKNKNGTSSVETAVGKTKQGIQVKSAESSSSAVSN